MRDDPARVSPADQHAIIRQAAAVTRIDGVVVGTYMGSGSAVPEEFLRQAAKVLALVSRAVLMTASAASSILNLD